MLRKHSDEVTSAVDSAAMAICDYISTGMFVPGQRLPEGDLAEQLGVSKTVVRAAFVKLDQEGILDVRLYKGAIVKRLSLAEMHDILTVIGAMLILSVEEAASAVAGDAEQRQVVAAARRRLEEAQPSNQKEHLQLFSSTFDAVLDVVSNDYLRETLQRAMNPLFMVFMLKSVEFTLEGVALTRSFVGVMEQIERGDVEQAHASARNWIKSMQYWLRPMKDLAVRGVARR